MASSLDMSLDDRIKNRSNRGRGRGRGRARPGRGPGRTQSGGRMTGAVRRGPLMELFSEIGELKHYAVHYDKNGHPSGSAEVVYTRRSDAFAALKRYNNVLLDRKPMKIEIVGANAELAISARVNVTGVNRQRKRTVVITPRGGRTGGPTLPGHGAA
ncbi:THO complex subunit 4C [Spatholobus suberectus]|nr:THO complex subunit 4C [Spatholobus suberectus]